VQEQIARNKRRTLVILGALFALVFVVLGALALVLGGGPVGVAVAFGVALGAAWVSFAGSERMALAATHAHPAPEEQYRRYHNLVESLCVAAGLPKPRLYVVDDPVPNACATGRNPKRAALVVTTGLLDGLNRVELEGVLAHELSHVKSYDVLVTTVAVGAVGPVARLLGPLGGYLMRTATDPDREYVADASGVLLTRYPPGLRSALEKLRDDRGAIRHATTVTAPLWIEQPLGAGPGRVDRRFDTHPPLEDRIERLREM